MNFYMKHTATFLYMKLSMELYYPWESSSLEGQQPALDGASGWVFKEMDSEL